MFVWDLLTDYLGDFTIPVLVVAWICFGLGIHFFGQRQYRSVAKRRFEKSPLEMYHLFGRFSWMYEGHPLKLVAEYRHTGKIDLPPTCYYDYRQFFAGIIEENITSVEGLNMKEQWLDVPAKKNDSSKNKRGGGRGDQSNSHSNSKYDNNNKQVIRIRYRAGHKIMDYLGSGYNGAIEFYSLDGGKACEINWYSEWEVLLGGSLLYPISPMAKAFFDTAFWNILLTLQWSIDGLENEKKAQA